MYYVETSFICINPCAHHMVSSLLKLEVTIPKDISQLIPVVFIIDEMPSARSLNSLSLTWAAQR